MMVAAPALAQSPLSMSPSASWSRAKQAPSQAGFDVHGGGGNSGSPNKKRRHKEPFAPDSAGSKSQDSVSSKRIDSNHPQSQNAKKDVTASLKTLAALDELLHNPVRFVKTRRIAGSSTFASSGSNGKAQEGDGAASTQQQPGLLLGLKNLIPVNLPYFINGTASVNGQPTAATTQAHDTRALNGTSRGKGRATADDAATEPFIDLWPYPLAMRFPNSAQVSTGLGNHGNTCYMNSVLQALLHTPPLADILLNRQKLAFLHSLASTMKDASPTTSPVSPGPAAFRGRARIPSASAAVSPQSHGASTHTFDPLASLARLAEATLVRRQQSAGAGAGAGTGGSGNRPIYPRAFNDHLPLFAKGLRRGRQEDAHEFLRLLLEALQAKCIAGLPPQPPSSVTASSSPIRKPATAAGEPTAEAKARARDATIKSSTFINRIFGGRFRSRVTCVSCKHPSDTFDAFLDISLDLNARAAFPSGGGGRTRGGGGGAMRPISSVVDALRQFTRAEPIGGGSGASQADKYKCEKCKRRVDAIKQFTVDVVPPILTVQLKRFSFTGRKITRPVAFPERLDVGPFMSEPPAPGTSKRRGCMYALYAIIHHHGGGPSSGHYVASVKDAHGRWARMDDDLVSRNHKLDLDDPSAYILFYMRETDQSPAEGPNAALGKIAAAAGAAASNHNPLLRAIGAIEVQRQSDGLKRKLADTEHDAALPNGEGGGAGVKKVRQASAYVDDLLTPAAASTGDPSAPNFFGGPSASSEKFHKPIDFAPPSKVRTSDTNGHASLSSPALARAAQSSAKVNGAAGAACWLPSSGAKGTPRRIALNGSDDDSSAADDEDVGMALERDSALGFSGVEHAGAAAGSEDEDQSEEDGSARDNSSDDDYNIEDSVADDDDDDEFLPGSKAKSTKGSKVIAGGDGKKQRRRRRSTGNKKPVHEQQQQRGKEAPGQGQPGPRLFNGRSLSVRQRGSGLHRGMQKRP
ncbi:cysteine proteinase [Tilletiaria anomala UBC 951]|uniref:Ubiquitin carboxyl-terminal hydrolase n=1 Tax=Tilletiaria anomala (strain ATCC 24038 / CBS 436.72 / UBC 951) TaxID=1037660 RepID=A0A066V4P2_TILAU|nr:cysteine proteinase [Tilletiaria anomala UBC 951]KDN36702.1 cysteine proteinase [Tilletiaria anomala UBC 951]